MGLGPYSPWKFIHHADRIEKLKRGEQVNPTFIMIIPSDLCNHDCNFCLTEDTILYTSRGYDYIQKVRVGDFVLGPSGEWCEVTETSKRKVRTTIQIKIGNETIRLTDNHKLLTLEGWKRADEVTVSDQIAINETVSKESSRASELLMRMREESYTAKRTLESVCEISSEKDWAYLGRAETDVEAHERRQSNEATGSSSKGFCQNEGETKSKVRKGEKKHSRGGATKDAFGSKSNERSREISEANEGGARTSEVETRNQDGIGNARLDLLRGRWINVDRKEESRFSDPREKASGGIDDSGSIYWEEGRENRGGVCDPDHRTLQVEGVELLSDLPEGCKKRNSERTTRSFKNLFGVKRPLERGVEYRSPDSILVIEEPVFVYNITCPPDHAYYANGIVVNNCAYRMSGYTSNTWFGESDPVSGIVNNNPNRMIPYEKIIEIIDDCVDMDIRAIEWTGGGEPTVHPKHREFFEYSLNAGRGNGLVTNGTVLRDGVPELLSSFDWVRVSIDAGRPESYAAIRSVPESFFQKSLDNIGRIAKARDANRHSKLILGVGYVVTRENYKEIDEAVKMYSDLGADNVRISAVFSPDDAGYFEGIYEECRDMAREAVAKYQRPGFRVFNLFGDRLSDLEQGSPDYTFCGFQQISSYIGGDLNVYRCCNTSYSPQGFIGSIQNQRLKDMWESKTKREAIASFDARTCERCQFSEKNRFINYVLEKDPDHVDFV